MRFNACIGEKKVCCILQRDETDRKSVFEKLLFLICGNLASVLGLNLFLAGNGIAAGGFSGIAVAINYVRYVPIGAFVFILTVPLLIWSFFRKNAAFAFLTLFSSALYSAAADLLSFLPCLTENRMVAAICGGIFYGVSALFFLRANCSSGGTDLLIRLLLITFRSLSFGRMAAVVDGCVVLTALLISGNIDAAIYALLTIAVSSYTVDTLVRGFNRASIFYVITDSASAAIAEAVMTRMRRGVTCINGLGMFRQSEKDILMVVIKPREIYRLKDIVRDIDPSAFVVLTPATEVLGSGFADIDVSS
jgi:uncharacterized membrane-anchored protein YitT (DUF2179 family)